MIFFLGWSKCLPKGSIPEWPGVDNVVETQRRRVDDWVSEVSQKRGEEPAVGRSDLEQRILSAQNDIRDDSGFSSYASVCKVSQERRQWSSSFKAVEISLAYWTKILTLLFGLSLIRSASRMASGSRTMMVTPAISSNDRCGWRSWTGFSGFQRRQEIASSLQTDVIGSRSTAI